jgi:hypothetical protein
VNDHPLNALYNFVKRFVVLPNEEDYFVFTLWIAHTYFTNDLTTSPRLALLSPEYGCGKSRSLELLEKLCFTGEKLDYCTRSYLMRQIEVIREDFGKSPTLLVDEVDSVFKAKSDDTSESLRAFLNTGYRKSGSYGITEGEGKNRQPKKFPTFCPMALAGKGEVIPESVRTRSIEIRLQKRMASQHIEDFLTNTVAFECEELVEWLLQWSDLTSQSLQTENVLVHSISDRDREVWLPLYAVAHLAGQEWIDRFTQALFLHQKVKKTSDIPRERELLKDCLTVFGERESMKTENLIEGLKILPESDYAGLNYGRGISPKYLAKMVRAYEIQPTQIRFGESTFKGYYRIQFATAYERYSEEAPAPSTPETIETPETVEGLF